MRLKEVNGQEIRFMIKGDGNKSGSAESFRERMSDDVEANINAVEEKENINAKSDDDEDEKEKEKKEEFVCKNEVGYSDSKAEICIDEDSKYTINIKENNSNGKSDRDNSEGKNSEEGYGENSIRKDSESAINNDCKWGGKSSKVDQTHEDQTTRGGGGTVDKDGAGDDGKYCSENRNLIINSDETVESCRPESKGEDLEGVDINSAFGIMSIYCNSKLHSWMSNENEDA